MFSKFVNWFKTEEADITADIALVKSEIVKLEAGVKLKVKFLEDALTADIGKIRTLVAKLEGAK